MIQRFASFKQVAHALACVLPLICFSRGLTAQNHELASSAPAVTMHVTHVLGFEGISKNASGNLSIQGNALRFQKSGGAGAQISVGSIQDIFLGEEDKQVGGKTAAVSKAAVPFGGGRLISLFSHKKYDSMTVEYLDTNGGLHGAIFQLNKGQAQVLKNELVAEGAHVTNPIDRPAKESAQANRNETK